MTIVTNNYKTIEASSAEDSNSKSKEMDTGKRSIYQRSFFIVAGSLLALLVFVAVAGHSGGGHVDYQVDSANLVFTKDIFGLSAAENDEGGPCTCSFGCDFFGITEACCICGCGPLNPCSF